MHIINNEFVGVALAWGCFFLEGGCPVGVIFKSSFSRRVDFYHYDDFLFLVNLEKESVKQKKTKF